MNFIKISNLFLKYDNNYNKYFPQYGNQQHAFSWFILCKIVTYLGSVCIRSEGFPPEEEVGPSGRRRRVKYLQKNAQMPKKMKIKKNRSF